MSSTQSADRPIVSGTGRATTLVEAFLASAARAPDRVALRTLGGATEITWSDYREQVRLHAAALGVLGIGRGERVALMTLNDPDFHVLDTALLHVGAVPISIYNTLPAEDIAWILGNADVRMVLAERAFVPVLSEVLAAGTSGLATVVCVDGAEPGTTPLADRLATAPVDFDLTGAARAVRPEDPATVSYTFGTTGPPKGVVPSQRAVLESLHALDSASRPADGGRVVAFLPMAHLAERVFSHYRSMVNAFTITTCPDPRVVPEHLLDSRPNYVFSPPRLFKKLRGAVEAGIERNEDSRGPGLRAAIDTGLRVVDLEQAGQRPDNRPRGGLRPSAG